MFPMMLPSPSSRGLSSLGIPAEFDTPPITFFKKCASYGHQTVDVDVCESYEAQMV